MKRIVILIISATFFVSCNEDPRVADLEERLRLADEQIKSLRTDVISLKISREFDGYTFLQPSEPSFSTMNLAVGSITVALKDVEAYADGCKVTLQFGNPLFCRINGVKFEVEYGSVDDRGILIEATKKTKKVTLSEPLQSGTFHDSVIILNGISPDKLGQLKIFNSSFEGVGLINTKEQKD